jgi:serine/threonine protein kinase
MLMATDRWQQIKEIFHSALDRAPEERSAYLVRACEDDESIRREVESLIAAHENESDFLDSPAYVVAAGLLTDEDSELKTGQMVGQYEIISLLGMGGMGEVYLAQDGKLKRKVALKLLPASYTKDADRLRRFEQEARAASALNHPNIITIYEIGEANGTHFIATEFIEGETLRQRAAQESLGLDETLHITIQIADALAAAHKAGIIHRDIKPENIMIRPDGYVKVLDFGLAKLAERSSSPAVSTEAVTRARERTTPGLVMGTVNYMSPEQARGLGVDERTDIWSMGVVLYEMLAGSAPFKGETPTDVTVSILEREQVSLAALLEGIPAELDWIVKKTLKKDRDERYQTIKEMLGDLRDIKQELEFEARLGRIAAPDRTGVEREISAQRRVESAATLITNRSAVIPTNEIAEARLKPIDLPVDKRSQRRIPIIAAGAAALILAVIGIALYKFFFQSKKAAPFQATNILRLTNHGKATSAAISPDGKYLVYVLSDASKQSLWLRQISAANDTQIVPPAPVGFFGLTFTRDGNDLYYVVKTNDAGTLYRIPVLGGTPVKLLEGIDCPVSFSPDGKRMTYVRGDYPNRGESGLFIANSDGSNVKQLAARKLPELFFPIFFTGPSWSPDGRLIASAVTNAKSEGRVIAFDVQDGTEQVLTSQAWPQVTRVEWLPDMSGLLMTARDQGSTVPQIWQLSYPDGETKKVTNDLSAYRAISLTADASKLVTIQVSGLINMWIMEGGSAESAVKLPSGGQQQQQALSGEAVNATQLSIGNIGYLGGNEGISWTPDGQIVFITSAGKRGDIWIVSPDGSKRKQLTFDAGNNTSPVVSPDGRFIVFTSDRSGTRNVWRINIDGSNAQRLTDSFAEFLPTISPDGQWVIYSSLNSGKITLWKVPLAGGAPVEIINREGINPAVSPDGKQIAYLFSESASRDAPPNRIAVIPFEGGEPVKTFEIPQGLAGAKTILYWSADGRSLLYTVIDNNVSNIWSQPLDGAKPVQLTNFKEHIITAFGWSRDGRQLACSRGILIRDAVLISNSK